MDIIVGNNLEYAITLLKREAIRNELPFTLKLCSSFYTKREKARFKTLRNIRRKKKVMSKMKRRGETEVHERPKSLAGWKGVTIPLKRDL